MTHVRPKITATQHSTTASYADDLLLSKHNKQTWFMALSPGRAGWASTRTVSSAGFSRGSQEVLLTVPPRADPVLKSTNWHASR